MPMTTLPQLIETIAQGNSVPSEYGWNTLKQELTLALDKIEKDSMADLSTDPSLSFIKDTLSKLDAPPYNIQRICELLQVPPSQPNCQYTQMGKYLFALERCFYATSPTTDPALLGTNQ